LTDTSTEHGFIADAGFEANAPYEECLGCQLLGTDWRTEIQIWWLRSGTACPIISMGVQKTVWTQKQNPAWQFWKRGWTPIF